MKKTLLFISILSLSTLNAQDITDAVQYAQQDIKGTARFRAMSGAFGALGGDLSALQINPAGSAVFLNSTGSVTLSTNRSYNEVSYAQDINTITQGNLNFNQIGAVFIFNSTKTNSIVDKISFGLAYDQTTDYADDFFASGRSNTSIDQFFIDHTQGVPLEMITPRTGESVDDLYSFLGEDEGYGVQQAFLGHEALITEATDLSNPDNTSYFSNISPGVFDQEYFYETTGLNGKFTLNGGAQIHDNFYIGFNLNSHFINYDKVTEFYEENNNAGSYINQVTFTNKLSTAGQGYSAQIGGIFKASKMIRLGISLESPTWYYINDETTQELKTYSNTDGGFTVDPNIINVFPEYELRTPAKATGSVAFLFGGQGLVSMDYSYKDYSSTKFSAEQGNAFIDQNRRIENNLTDVSSLRLGGEWRNGNWSFRAGYRFEESPYKDDKIMGEKTGASFGIGYNFGKIKLDIAYDYTEQQRSQQFYPNSGFSNSFLIDNYKNDLTFTLGLNL